MISSYVYFQSIHSCSFYLSMAVIVLGMQNSFGMEKNAPSTPSIPVPLLCSSVPRVNSPVAAHTPTQSAPLSSSPSGQIPECLAEKPGFAELMGVCIKCMKRIRVIKPFNCGHRYCVECDRIHNRQGCFECNEISRDCVICFNELTQANKYGLVCNHYFCTECSSKWYHEQNRKNIKPTCPMCRAPFEPKVGFYCEFCNEHEKAGPKNYFTNEDEVTAHTCKVEPWFWGDPAPYKHFYHDACLQYRHIIKCHQNRTLRRKEDVVSYPCPMHKNTYHDLRPGAIDYIQGNPPPPGITQEEKQAVLVALQPERGPDFADLMWYYRTY